MGNLIWHSEWWEAEYWQVFEWIHKNLKTEGRVWMFATLIYVIPPLACWCDSVCVGTRHSVLTLQPDVLTCRRCHTWSQDVRLPTLLKIVRTPYCAAFCNVFVEKLRNQIIGFVLSSQDISQFVHTVCQRHIVWACYWIDIYFFQVQSGCCCFFYHLSNYHGLKTKLPLSLRLFNEKHGWSDRVLDQSQLQQCFMSLLWTTHEPLFALYFVFLEDKTLTIVLNPQRDVLSSRWHLLKFAKLFNNQKEDGSPVAGK